MTATSEVATLIAGGMHPAEATSIDRNDAIALIRAALKERSGKTWSVTGDSGTAWGWINIQSPPARRVSQDGTRKGDGTDWYMTDAEVAELAALLNLSEHMVRGGVSIAADTSYRCEYIARAKGLAPVHYGVRYWD